MDYVMSDVEVQIEVESVGMSESEFQQDFVNFRHELRSYLLRITANREDAEDLAQDTYLKALKNLDSYAGQSSLKTWVFTIGTNLARDYLRTKKRWHEDYQEKCREAHIQRPALTATLMSVHASSPAGKFELKEHINYCFTCMAKTLEIEKQVCLILKDIYDFTMVEIMEILGMSEGQVRWAITDARKIMTDIFDRKCAIVNKQGVCQQCTELVGILNPKQNAREKLMEIKMARDAEEGASKEHLYDLRTKLIKEIDPLNAEGTDLHSYLLNLLPTLESD